MNLPQIMPMKSTFFFSFCYSYADTMLLKAFKLNYFAVVMTLAAPLIFLPRSPQAYLLLLFLVYFCVQFLGVVRMGLLILGTAVYSASVSVLLVYLGHAEMILLLLIHSIALAIVGDKVAVYVESRVPCLKPKWDDLFK